LYFGSGSATLSVFNSPDSLDGNQYRLVVTNSCGTDISTPATLTVNTGPSIDTQPSNTTVCEGEDAIFEVIASGTGLTFQWQENSGGGFFDISDGPLYSGTNTAQLTVNNVTLPQSSFQYRVIVSGACVPPLLQQISSPVVLLVDQLPSVVVDPVANPICAGDNLTLQVTAIGTGITYQWEEDSGSGFVPLTDGGVYSGTNTPNLSLSSVPDTFDGNLYRARVTGVCTPAAVSANVAITVHTLPTASFVGNGDACTGANLTFTLTGVGPFDVTYNNGISNTTLIGISDGHVEVVEPNVTTTYTLVSVLDNNAPRCSGTVDPTPVTIIGLQNISALIDVVPNTPQVVNVNTTFNFDASGTTTAIPIANLTFDWDFGDGNTISGMGTNPVNITHPNGSTTTGTFLQPVHTYFPTPGNYFVNLTVSYGMCESSTTNGVAIEPVPPTVDFTFTPSDGCAPLTVQFFEQAEFEDPNSYFWNFGDGTFSAVGEANPVHVYTDPGLYTVSLEVTNSIGIIVQEIKNEIIQVNELPVAIFRNRPLEVIEIPDQVMETSNLSIGADIYTWDFGDGHVLRAPAGTVIDTVYDDGATTTNTIDEPTHQYVTTGIYDLTLIAESSLGCADTLTTTIEVIEADDIRVPNVFTPSTGGPNDSEGNVNENLMGGDNANNIFIPVFRDVVEFHMQVFDRWGNLIFESFSENRGWDGYYKGQLAQSDVYVYKVVVRLKNNEVVTSVGDVTLVR
jgi:gliding motility-associated-like protein